MNRPLTIAALSSSLLLTGCNGALWGNMLVLMVTVGIFFGTLGLGRPEAAQSRADASTSSTGHS